MSIKPIKIMEKPENTYEIDFIKAFFLSILIVEINVMNATL
jgi:hypothetical protein